MKTSYQWKHALIGRRGGSHFMWLDCIKGALYIIGCGVNRLGDSGVKVV